MSATNRLGRLSVPWTRRLPVASIFFAAILIIFGDLPPFAYYVITGITAVVMII